MRIITVFIFDLVDLVPVGKSVVKVGKLPSQISILTLTHEKSQIGHTVDVMACRNPLGCPPRHALIDTISCECLYADLPITFESKILLKDIQLLWKEVKISDFSYYWYRLAQFRQ